MKNDVKKKITASAILFTLMAVVFIPLVSSQVENLVSPSTRGGIHWWNPEWPYRKLLTIDHTKINGNLINFPVLISLSSDPQLAASAQPTGQDIVFVRYADNTTALNHEIELFNHINGQLVAWVNITSVSATSDTKLWMYYGNTICGPQENIAGTWDGNYVMVQHLNETGDTLYDSTPYNNNGLSTGTDFTDTGKIDGARQYDGNDKIVVNDFTNSPNGLTVEVWVYRDATAFIYIACKGTYSYTNDWILYLRNNQPGNEGIDFGINNHSKLIRTGDTPVNSWFALTATYDNGNAALYFNGTQIGSATGWPAITNSYPHLGLGNDYMGTEGNIYPMTQVKLDEIRVSKTARNYSWISTGYNNQNDPSAFYALGAEEQYPYTLTISLNGQGDVAKNPDQLTYPYGTVVTLTASPDIGWSFNHWSGDASGTNPVTTVTMNGNKSVTAHFTQNVYTLTIIVDPLAGGSVGAVPSPPYHYGDAVTLTTTANPGYSFNHWSGDASGSNPVTTLTMTGNKAVTAHFTQNVYTLTIIVDPLASGSVGKVPDPPYHYGDVVTLTATANPTYMFDYWSGDLTGDLNPATLIIDENKTVIASFIFGNTPPVAVNDSATVLRNSSNTSIDVLANDYDSDGDNLTIISVKQPSNGTSSQDGTFVYYTPFTSYLGPDSFTYSISDGKGGNASATVFITVVPINNPPNIPDHPIPEDDQNNVAITIDLGWSGGDPDEGDTVRYDVYFGNTSSPVLMSSNQSTSTYDLDTLDYATTYYWQIVSWDNHNTSTVGPLWQFTTQPKDEDSIVVNITRPLANSFYFRNFRLFRLPRTTVIYGPITITAKVTADAEVSRVEFIIDGKLKRTDTTPPYTYRWAPLRSFKHTILVKAYDINEHTASDGLTVFKWRLHPIIIIGGAALLTSMT